jgi:hypothetical protein
VRSVNHKKDISVIIPDVVADIVVAAAAVVVLDTVVENDHYLAPVLMTYICRIFIHVYTYLYI